MERRDQPAVRLVINQDFNQDPTAANAELVRALRDMLAAAQRGTLVGIVCATMYSGGSYQISTLGQARANPTFARGMVRAIDDRLADLVAMRG